MSVLRSRSSRRFSWIASSVGSRVSLGTRKWAIAVCVARQRAAAVKEALEQVIAARKGGDASRSYTAKLLAGGAVALASAERVLMLEHAVYSVISPEGCASILWRTAEKAADAAEAMKVTAQDLLGLGVIDRIVKEPVGGAHRDHDLAIKTVGNSIEAALKTLAPLSSDQIRAKRADKFLAIGRKL